MSVAIGIVGVVIASLFWGSNFVVCKNYALPPDGMHFVLLMSTGILLVGLLSLLFSERANGDFEAVFAPYGLLGGTIWALGNFLTVPIVQNVGLGIGLAVWAGVNLVVAFVVGSLGLASVLPAEELHDPLLGAVGIVLAVGALVLFALVEPTLEEKSEVPWGLEEPLVTEATGEEEGAADGKSYQQASIEGVAFPPLGINDPDSFVSADEEHGEISARSGTENQGGGNAPFGIAMAVIAGTLYGFQFVPLSIWDSKVSQYGIFGRDRPSEAVEALRFFFSQFTGIFLTSLMGFIIYCIWTGNQPKLVPPNAMLPSLCSGIVWAVGCGGGMLATAGLGNAVGFPLLLNISFLVNSSWSILYYREIRGPRNLRYFGAAFALNVASSVLISLSKSG